MRSAPSTIEELVRWIEQPSSASVRVLIVGGGVAVEDIDRVLRTWGCDTRQTACGGQALAAAPEWRPHLAVVDMDLAGSNGGDVLQRLHALMPDLQSIAFSRHRSLQSALAAAHCGAICCLDTPVSALALRSVLARVETRVCAADLAAGGEDALAPVITRNPRMLEALDLVRTVAPTGANVLILGENGTGKELIANAVHVLGAGPRRPFVKVNCAAIPPDLFEAELFGHRRGAFTGAIADRPGLLEAASGGTVLLDEIGELPLHLQVKLLRALEDRQVVPVGSTRARLLDFRLICATNSDLGVAMRAGRFRQDLYFRINTVTIALPPLRDRPEDIVPLAEHFLRGYAAEYGCRYSHLDDAARKRLVEHSWPGNVRELEHAIERAVILSRARTLTAADFPEPTAMPGRGPARAPVVSLAEIEREMILRALEQTRGNKRAAAELLGIYRATLYSKLRKYGLDRGIACDAHQRRARRG